MDLDMELVYGNEDYEELQEYFEHRKYDYPSGSQNMLERLKIEYIPEIWEETDEGNKVSNRQQTLRRIWDLLEEVPSDIKESSFGETESEG